MISVTKLLFDTEYYGDTLRYSQTGQETLHGANGSSGPVVVWNSTRTCNLHCVHCYMDSDSKKYTGELSTGEAKKFIDDLADFRVPVLLFSGGEPLIRPDFFELAEYAAAKGIRPTLSTNGTLITREIAERIKQIGIGYVGISLDGLREINDRFRGKDGAFQAAMEGIQNCVAAGQRVGLRFTINRHNYEELDSIFDFIEEENIDRVCFYHLVYSGRGQGMMGEDLSPEESRLAMDVIIDRTLDFQQRGLKKEILTVDNHCDGVYLYLRTLKEDPIRACKIKNLIGLNGGNRSGIAFGEVDPWGYVHPDQFTQHITFGNVRERKFGDIWTDMNHPILAGLRNRKPLLKGRCSRCQYVSFCNGNFRTRAEAATGDLWESDPACYLTDEEITTKEVSFLK
ncbi:MAG: putative heme d1 biosynthesis radical SAM protein NirJ1 [Peptococcaceae bacterium]|nr:putative heme d1 biosynthesis radical SAM protein NirJ1 [Peptococcaceae bacterium]